MKNRDYLWCLLNELLDKEDALQQMCPTCRSKAVEEHCSVCGQSRAHWGEGAQNPAFDSERYERLKKGGGA